MRNFGALEIGLIVVAIVLIFGIGKLGQVGGALGKSIREFRREKDKKDGDSEVASADAKNEKAAAKSTKEKFCPGCGNKISANAKFCMECGAKMGDYN
jgi:sec-independent protein translocase protein TatA